MKTSKLYRVDWRDVAQGLIMAILAPVLVILQSSLDAGHFSVNWKQAGMAAVAGGVGYLLKNFFSDSKTLTKDGTE